MTATLNNINDHYQTDLFLPIIERLIAISGKKYSFKNGVPHRVIADHLRMVSFSLSDGIMPSNEGRGYVVRRVLRRAARFGRVLNIEKEFIYTLVDTLISTLGDAYPDLKEKKEHIKKVIKSEEASFGKTLDRGLQLFEDICDKSDNKILDGKDVFKLYDTYGFPIDLTELLAREKNINIDKASFEKLMENQKKLARQNNKFKFDGNEEEWIVINDKGSHEFVGYVESKIETLISKYRKVNDSNFELILEKTPFYAESGGQIGDSGKITSKDFHFTVNDTYYVDNQICHFGKFEDGTLSKKYSNKVLAVINNSKRNNIKVNHTSTHLLHQALKTILGNEVQQAGSLVSHDHLRFDFTYYQKVDPQQIDQIEDIVNKIIRKNISLSTNIMKFDTAKKEGAVALFGEKYDDDVRVVDVDGFSKELCGGTHIDNTGQIGLFKIVSESSLASGIRRIEAYTGQRAFNYIRDKILLNTNVQKLLMCNEEDILEKIKNINLSNKKYKKDIIELNIVKAKQQTSIIIENNLENVNGTKLLIGKMDIDLAPQLLSDVIRQMLLDKAIALIGLKSNGKKFILCSITKDLDDCINAGSIIKNIASEINAKGGGSRFMATLNIDSKLSFKSILNSGKKIIDNLLIEKNEH